MREDRSSVNRRQFLTASTAGATALLAGCNTSSGTNKTNNSTESTPAVTTMNGPAQFARISLAGPSKVTVGESFRLTLTATNVGGRTGTFKAQLRIAEGASTLSRTVSRKSVAPKESISVTTDSIRFTRADTYVFALGASDVTHSVTVQSKTQSVGTALKLSDSLRATVTDVAFRPSLFYTGDAKGDTRLLSASSGKVLALIRLTLENIGTKTTSVTADPFQVPSGQMVSALGNGTPLTAAQITGKPLTTLQLAPAEQRERWLLAQVPRSEARKKFTLAYQRDAAGTPPEFQWIAAPDDGKRTLPQFSVKQFQLPKSVEAGTDTTATVAVSNTGKETRTFRGMVESRSSDNGDWQPIQPIQARIRPGKTARKQFTINSSSTGSVTYRIAPLGATKTVEFTAPTLPFGGTYTTTENVAVTARNLQSASVVRSHPLAMDPVTRTKPLPGDRLVLVHIRSVTVGPSQGTPFGTEFTLRAGSRTFEKLTNMSEELFFPVDGRVYDGVYDPAEGETFKGYLVWSVPKQVPLTDLTVQWTSQEPSTGSEGETVRWTKGGKNRSS
jgi:hypothetical protein